MIWAKDVNARAESKISQKEDIGVQILIKLLKAAVLNRELSRITLNIDL